jgi:hypothetical protein
MCIKSSLKQTSLLITLLLSVNTYLRPMERSPQDFVPAGARKPGVLTRFWRNTVTGHADPVLKALRDKKAANTTDFLHQVDWAVEELIDAKRISDLEELVKLCEDQKIKVSTVTLVRAHDFLDQTHGVENRILAELREHRINLIDRVRTLQRIDEAVKALIGQNRPEELADLLKLCERRVDINHASLESAHEFLLTQKKLQLVKMLIEMEKGSERLRALKAGQTKAGKHSGDSDDEDYKDLKGVFAKMMASLNEPQSEQRQSGHISLQSAAPKPLPQAPFQAESREEGAHRQGESQPHGSEGHRNPEDPKQGGSSKHDETQKEKRS